MVRDDLYITVPSLFRCPISLDVMKSPVSLSTGVTYDRASIQRWLDGGNNTCPATMQVLQSKEFVPNRTLQRLIQIWSDHHISHGHVATTTTTTNNSVPSLDEIKCIVKGEDNEESCLLNALAKIECFAKESEENKEFLAKMDEFLPMLVHFIGKIDNVVIDDNNIEYLEQIFRILNLIIAKADTNKLSALMLKENKNCLYSILLVLQQGRSVDSRVGLIKVLESIAIDAEAKLLISENEALLSQLIKSISVETDPNLIDASLSCLSSVSKPRRVKVKLVQLKVIAELKKILIGFENGSVSVTEKALRLLETVSCCKEGRADMDAGCVEAVVGKVLKVSAEATEHAVTILWSVCCVFRDQRVQEAVNRSNGLTKILLLMQSNCSPAVRQMAGDLLKIFRVNSKSCLSSYDTKTTHIMPF